MTTDVLLVEENLMPENCNSSFITITIGKLHHFHQTLLQKIDQIIYSVRLGREI